ncbi:MAG: CYTH domain-containing protein [Candidatus Marsarchaeota archaeon]|jgi:adenylate cyclase class 2|nr:CYTH domain-containing protein [Candidatus Marsarchaeota archaeon]MCL5111546.1 CYTH domain-containing protein [Candidatus Marsarchaeota archaeon]
MIEIETKIIDFDENRLKAELKKRGIRGTGEILQRRWIFNLSKNDGSDEFIRVRTDGKKCTIAYKYRKGEGLGNTEEIEVATDNFDNAAEIFSKLIKSKKYQENKRETFMLGAVEITINRWPMIPPVLEIEAPSEKEVRDVIKEFSIAGKELGNIGWEKLYKQYGIDLNAYEFLKFK